MRKWKKVLLTVIPAALALTMTSVAGEWKADQTGWWYQKDDGSWDNDGWHWIDGNKDGLAECYYFEPSGYITLGGKTADGYTVNADGAWVENGVVQKKVMGVVNGNDTAAAAAYVAAVGKTSAMDSMDMNSGYSVSMTMSNDDDVQFTMEVGSDQHLQMSGATTDNPKFVMDGTMTTLGTTIPTRMFYTDGYYYYDAIGTKTKIAITADLAKANAESNMNGVDLDMSQMRNMKISQSGENQVITFELDDAYMKQRMMESAGVSASEDTKVDCTVKDYSGSIVIDKNGYCSDQNVYMNMDMVITYISAGETVKMNCTMEISMKYNNPGQKVTVVIPSTDGYTEVTSES